MNRPSRLYDLCVVQRRWRSVALPPLSSSDQGMGYPPPPTTPTVLRAVCAIRCSRARTVRRRENGAGMPGVPTALIIQRMLRNQPITLTPEQRLRITSAQQTCNPLFLTILLEYLTCTTLSQGTSAPAMHQDIEQQLSMYLSAPDGTHMRANILGAPLGARPTAAGALTGHACIGRPPTLDAASQRITCTSASSSGWRPSLA